MAFFFFFFKESRDSRNSSGTRSLQALMALATYLFLTPYLALAPRVTWSCLVLVHAIVTALGATSIVAEVEIST